VNGKSQSDAAAQGGQDSAGRRRNHGAARELLRALFDAAVAAADPAKLITEQAMAALLPDPVSGRTVVVGAGKASAAMARAFEKAWSGPPLEGLVITRQGHGAPCDRIAVIEARHPVPNRAGKDAARRILDLTAGLGPDDQLVCLISGGGSALLALPAPGLTLADKQAVTRDLLRSGATIDEINTVRKHLSAIKGGRLAAATPARILTLAISDVPGDDPAVIASGPTVPDPTTFADARAVLAKYRIAPPPAVTAHLTAAAEETPKPGDPLFRRTRFELLASPQQALAAAADAALARGVTPIVLSDRIEGEARDVGGVHAAIALQLAAGQLRVGGSVVAPPAVLLSGGETTVTVRGNGRGGRNVEFLLGLSAALARDPAGAAGIAALACDTDGIDGTEDNAGAIVYPDTLARAAMRDIALDKALAENDGYGFFAALGDLIVTGPTLTNVNDFRAILILANARRG
jgi:hydroxypyruvate reductase